MESTDVKHSIAGFYYQLLLACKEIAKLLSMKKSKNAYVAIEYGADIRVFDEENLFIEAKFYNINSFSRYHQAITHSIYNFYNTFKEGKKGRFVFRPNIPASKTDIPFFSNWPKNTTPSVEYIKYIKECFVCESITKNPIKEGKFKKFKEEYQQAHPDKKKPHYRLALIKHLDVLSNENEYKAYIIPDIEFTDADIQSFINRIDFDFPEIRREKYQSIKEIKKIIDNSIMQYRNDLSEEQIKKIRLLILESFLDSTIHEVNDLSVQANLRIVKVSDCEQIINEVDTKELKYLNNEEVEEIIEEIEKELDAYENLLRIRGYQESASEIMPVLINMKEQLYLEIKKHGVRNVSRRYVLAKRAYPIEILRLFENVCEMMFKTNRILKQVSIKDQKGINNVSMDDGLSFSMQTLPAASSARYNARSYINEFINHTKEHFLISKAEGNETILFDSECDFCQYNKSEIDNTLIDIFQTDKNIEYQEYYKNFDYKCTKCMRLAFEGTCELLDSIKEKGDGAIETTDGLIKN